MDETKTRSDCNTTPLLSTDNSHASHQQRSSRSDMHARPIPDAYSRRSDDSSPKTFQLSRSIVSPKNSVEALVPGITFPCIARSLDALIESMITVLEDVNFVPIGTREITTGNAGDETRRIDVAKLKQCFACDLCSLPIQDAYTSVTCMHSFCRECIKMAMETVRVDKMCPVKGCGTLTPNGLRPTSLGPNPFDGPSPKITKDKSLSNLLDNIYEHHANDLSIQEEAEEQFVPNIYLPLISIKHYGSIKSIQPKQPTMGKNELLDEGSSVIPLKAEDQTMTLTSEYMTFAVFPRQGVDGLREIEDNYYYLPSTLTVGQLQGYLEERYHLEGLQLFCRDVCISESALENRTMKTIHSDFWRQCNQVDNDVCTLFYEHEPLVMCT